MNNLVRLTKTISSTITGSHFDPKNIVVGVRFYHSTPTGNQWRRREPPWKTLLQQMSRRLKQIRDHNVSVIPVLDKWIQEGKPINEDLIHALIKDLRRFRRYNHALEVSMWMTDKRYFVLMSRDVAVRLDLISKVHGIEQVESYFNNIPTKLKGLESYGALLNCYAYAKCVEKAEAIMQRMRELGFARTSLSYTVMLNLYYKTGNTEKLETLMQEMEENGIDYDKFAYSIRLSACAAASDIGGMEKTLARMESDPKVILDWVNYAAVASCYTKVGLLDKALKMLKKAERLITWEKESQPYDTLITQYAAVGAKDDVLRVWEMWKKNARNWKYISIITSLLKFYDIESAEKIFEEWESQNSCYEIAIPNFLIEAYCKKGLLEKAETLKQRALSKGAKLNTKTWYCLAKGYIEHRQMPKAVEAMREMIILSGPRTRPSTKSMVACLEHLKRSGDLDEAEGFIKLLREKDIVSLDIEDKLLSFMKDMNSNMGAFSVWKGNSSEENSIPLGLSSPEEDSGD